MLSLILLHLLLLGLQLAVQLVAHRLPFVTTLTDMTCEVIVGHAHVLWHFVAPVRVGVAIVARNSEPYTLTPLWHLCVCGACGTKVPEWYTG